MLPQRLCSCGWLRLHRCCHPSARQCLPPRTFHCLGRPTQRVEVLKASQSFDGVQLHCQCNLDVQVAQLGHRSRQGLQHLGEEGAKGGVEGHSLRGRTRERGGGCSNAMGHPYDDVAACYPALHKR